MPGAKGRPQGVFRVLKYKRQLLIATPCSITLMKTYGLISDLAL